MTTSPAGWYPDPNGQLRFWDGVHWTAQTAPPPSSVALAPSPIQVEVVPKRRTVGQQVTRGVIVAGAVLAVAVGASWVDQSNKAQESHQAYCEVFGADDPSC
jgi:hypothetical protein